MPRKSLYLFPLLFALLMLASCSKQEAPPETAEPETESMPELEIPSETEVPPETEPEPEPMPEPKATVPEPSGTPQVTMVTSMGAIVIELNPERAPETVSNFLRYVDEKFYDNTIFHRVMPNFMIQGGGMIADMSEKPTHSPIKNESGNALSNLKYSIAMARTADPHSATAQFYINHVSNRALDKDQARDSWGYCVFGKVISGKEVVDAIAQVSTGNKGNHQNVPVSPITIQSARRTAGG